MKKLTRLLSILLSLTLCMAMFAPFASAGEAPTEFTVLTMRWGDMGDSFTQNQFLIDLEKELNVKINWVAVSNNDWEEQRGILLAGGDLPDMFIGNMTLRDTDVSTNLPFFMELTDLIENHMPNYTAAMETTPALRSLTTNPDGKIYSFAKVQPARPTVRNQMIINKVWLDNLGLDIPTNIDELKDVMIAFKEQDPNGNGLADEIPYTFNGDNIPSDWLNPFGITDINESNMSIVNGEVFFWPASDRYKEGLKWSRELWSLGVIDQESFTQDWSMIQNKWVNEEIPIVGITLQWTPGAVTGKWADQYVAIPPIAGPDGEQYAGGDPDGIFAMMRNEAHITTQCENPELAAQWLDAFYTPEASIQNFWGAIGTVITKNDDGTYSLNEPPAGVDADAWYWDQSLRDFGPKYVPPGFNDQLKLDPTSGDGLKLEIAKMAEEFVTQPYPAVMFTEEENDELAILTTDILAYCNQTSAAWIAGQGDIDADWDGYIEQLNRMGLERYIEIKMAAYDRWVNN